MGTWVGLTQGVCSEGGRGGGPYVALGAPLCARGSPHNPTLSKASDNLSKGAGFGSRLTRLLGLPCVPGGGSCIPPPGNYYCTLLAFVGAHRGGLSYEARGAATLPGGTRL